MSHKSQYIQSRRFTVDDRLRSTPDITQLFQSNESFFVYPFKVIVRETLTDEAPLRLLISVPKRKHKKATDRNRIKRLIREGWRHHKHELRMALLNNEKQLHVGLVYTAEDILPFHQLEGKIMLILQRLLSQYRAP